MKLPEIGDIVTTQWAKELCRHFGLDYLVDRIDTHPERYKEWKFDGCSGLPDELMGFFTGCDWRDITYLCCLPHDLGYAYGTPGDHNEKQMVDDKFFGDLKEKAGMKEWIAAVFRKAVEIGGAEMLGLSFSWAFANKQLD
jgi:hypothetical protein